MPTRLRHTMIALVGLKHVGKSSVARLLSERCGMDNADTDDLIMVRYKLTEQKDQPGLIQTARELYRLAGRDYFLELERAVIQDLLSRNRDGDKGIILSTGGGIAENEKALDLLVPNFYTVFLDEEIEILYERVMRRGMPAFLDPDRPYEHFKELSERRKGRYRTAARLTIAVSGRSISAVTDEIIMQLR